MREVPASDITQALAGRIAGLEMMGTSSRPGASMQIRIRGSRSLTASNDPLVVLDGIPFAGQLNDIDPNNIKSLDILKDASSTAIYGSRGANGVIMITTKTGSRGEERPATLTYNGYYGIKNAERYDMMTGDQLFALKEYLRGQQELGKVAGTVYPGLGADERQGVNTDWQDLVLRQGWVTNHDVGVTGGTRTASYSFGATYYHDQAVIPLNNFTRYSLRANIDTEVGKWVRIGLTSNSNYNYTQGNQYGLNLQASPLADPYNEDGSLKDRISYASDSSQWVTTRETIEKYEDLWRDDTRRFGTFNNIYAEVKAPWVEGLKYRINLGLNFNQQHRGESRGMGIGRTSPTELTNSTVTQNWRTNWTVENLLTYDRLFNGKHSVNAVALFSAEQSTFTQNQMAGRNFPDESMQYWNPGQGLEAPIVPPGEQRYTRSGLLSYMGRVMYTYADRYMISAGVRSDASSRLAPGHQWHTYPAVSVGWNISEESFMQSATWLDALKIRVGYGQTSNQAVAEYSTLGTLATNQVSLGSNFLTGFAVTGLPNPSLGWEFTQTWNYGIDFELFQRRLTGTIEYYTQKTHNVLQSVSLPASGGVGSYMANVGKTQNKGFELTLNGTIINSNGWRWSAGVNLYLNRNKLVELASQQQAVEGNNWFVGHPLNVWYTQKVIGLWQEGDPYMDILEPGANPGSIRVEYLGEYNADGSPKRALGDLDRQIMNMDPNFQGGFNTRVTWKGIDLSIIGQFQNGGLLRTNLYDGGGYNNMLSGRRGQVDVDYWRPDNTGAYWPNPAGKRDTDNIRYMDNLAIFDASYLSISNITLGYTIPRKWMDSSGFKNVRVYAMAQNPFVFFSDFKKMSGLTPQTNSGGNQGNTGRGRLLSLSAGVPFSKNFLFGLNLSF
jgi:TonB-linked SusC/RagA family outer membrane protein